jgi:hypothetical protein
MTLPRALTAAAFGLLIGLIINAAMTAHIAQQIGV